MRVGALLLILALVMAGCGGKEERKTMHLQKGKAYYAEANYNKARIELQNVLQIDPKTPEANYMIGLIDEQQENWQSAFGNYRKAVELDPDYIEAKVRLGRLYILSGALPETENSVDYVLARRPGDSGGRFEGRSLVRKGDIDGATREPEVVAADPAQSRDLLQGLYPPGTTRGLRKSWKRRQSQSEEYSHATWLVLAKRMN
jgi:tetratricopeptide (TPR) repeat protein